jgi:hypothetical protein
LSLLHFIERKLVAFVSPPEFHAPLLGALATHARGVDFEPGFHARRQAQHAGRQAGTQIMGKRRAGKRLRFWFTMILSICKFSVS